MEFIEKREMLYNFQSGFQKNHSTDFCLSYLTDKKSNGFDSVLLTRLLLIGLQKLFDTIDESYKSCRHLNFQTKWLTGLDHTYLVGDSLQLPN